jgi:hypothetical protein
LKKNDKKKIEFLENTESYFSRTIWTFDKRTHQTKVEISGTYQIRASFGRWSLLINKFLARKYLQNISKISPKYLQNIPQNICGIDIFDL